MQASTSSKPTAEAADDQFAAANDMNIIHKILMKSASAIHEQATLSGYTIQNLNPCPIDTTLRTCEPCHPQSAATAPVVRGRTFQMH
jgi:hypothetical protein